MRLVAVSTDPTTLPANSSWYLTTNLPTSGSRRVAESAFEPADLAEVARLYGLRMWVEQSYKHTKGELGFSDFQVRSDHAIRRHWQLVLCAFSFCWWACTREHDATLIDAAPETHPVPEEVGGKEEETEKERPPLSWPVALRRVRSSWLDPWITLWRFWRAWSKAPPPPQLRALLDAVGGGRQLNVYVPI